MKVKHWIGLILVVIGGLYVAHLMMSHGGVQGFRQGIGLGG